MEKSPESPAIWKLCLSGPYPGPAIFDPRRNGFHTHRLPDPR